MPIVSKLCKNLLSILQAIVWAAWVVPPVLAALPPPKQPYFTNASVYLYYKLLYRARLRAINYETTVMQCSRTMQLISRYLHIDRNMLWMRSILLLRKHYSTEMHILAWGSAYAAICSQ